jgi:hypothetical protein
MEYKWDFPWISHGFPMGSVPMDSHPILGLPQDLHGTWHLRSKGHEAQRPGPVCNIGSYWILLDPIGSYWILLDPIGWFSWGKPLFIKQPVGNGHPWHYQQSCSTHGWQDMGSEHEWTMSWDACLQEDHDQRILGANDWNWNLLIQVYRFGRAIPRIPTKITKETGNQKEFRRPDQHNRITATMTMMMMTITWSHDHMITWSHDHMITWSHDHMTMTMMMTMIDQMQQTCGKWKKHNDQQMKGSKTTNSSTWHQLRSQTIVLVRKLGTGRGAIKKHMFFPCGLS